MTQRILATRFHLKKIKLIIERIDYDRGNTFYRAPCVINVRLDIN